MGKSTRVRLSDLRQVHWLVGEIVEMGAEPETWRLHLVTQLHRIFSLQTAHAWTTPLPLTSKSGQVGRIAYFGIDEGTSKLWLEYAARGDFTSNPERDSKTICQTLHGRSPDVLRRPRVVRLSLLQRFSKENP